MSRAPDFDELLGGEELTPNERERLRLAHDLLVQAGPPEELPPALADPPETRARVTLLPRRRRTALALIAAGAAAAAFLRAGLVDEAVVHLAPKLLGAGPSLVGDLGISGIGAALSLSVAELTPLGGDVQIRLHPTRHTGGGTRTGGDGTDGRD